MRFWLLRFFLHIEYAHVVINDNDSSALEFLYRWLLMQLVFFDFSCLELEIFIPQQILHHHQGKHGKVRICDIGNWPC